MFITHLVYVYTAYSCSLGQLVEDEKAANPPRATVMIQIYINTIIYTST